MSNLKNDLSEVVKIIFIYNSNNIVYFAERYKIFESVINKLESQINLKRGYTLLFSFKNKDITDKKHMFIGQLFPKVKTTVNIKVTLVQENNIKKSQKEKLNNTKDHNSPNKIKNFSIKNNKCLCSENIINDKKNPDFFCSKCNKFGCEICINNHLNHHMININKNGSLQNSIKNYGNYIQNEIKINIDSSDNYKEKDNNNFKNVSYNMYNYFNEIDLDQKKEKLNKEDVKNIINQNKKIKEEIDNKYQFLYDHCNKYNRKKDINNFLVNFDDSLKIEDKFKKVSEGLNLINRIYGHSINIFNISKEIENCMNEVFDFDKNKFITDSKFDSIFNDFTDHITS